MRFARTKQVLKGVARDQRDHDESWPPRDLTDVVGPNPRDSWPDWTDRPIPYAFGPARLGSPERPPLPSRRSFLGVMLGTAAAGSALPPTVRAVTAAGSPGPMRAAQRRMTAISAEVRQIEASGHGLPYGAATEAQEDQLAEALDRATAVSRGLVELVLAMAGKSLNSLVITEADEDSPWAVASAREGQLVVAVTISASNGWMFDVTQNGYCVRPTFMELPGVAS